MKKVLVIASAVMVSALLAGCMEKKIVVAQPLEEAADAPDTEIHEGEIVFDMQQTYDDCVDLLNKDDYPNGIAIDFQIDDEAKMVGLAWAVTDECSAEEACEYGEAYIKAFNDAMATQDFSFAVSNEDYYGGFFDYFGVQIYVFHESDQDNIDKYLVNQIVPAGTHDKLKPYGK